MKKGIIFDLDGTLWDSSQAVVDAWNYALNGKYRFTLEEMQSQMGKTMDDIAYTLFPNETKEEALRLMTMCTDYENEYIEKHGGNLYPDVRETLEKLRLDYHLSIVSNCQEGYIEAFVNYYHLNDLIEDTENFGRTGKGKADNIRLVVERNHLDQAVYVGDIEADYKSSCEAGVPFIFAKYGFGHVENTPYIEKFSDLIEVVKAL